MSTPKYVQKYMIFLEQKQKWRVLHENGNKMVFLSGAPGKWNFGIGMAESFPFQSA